MPTTIDVDDELLREAMAAAGQTDERSTVEEGLRRLIRLRGQLAALKDLEGLSWDGDPMRCAAIAERTGRETGQSLHLMAV